MAPPKTEEKSRKTVKEISLTRNPERLVCHALLVFCFSCFHLSSPISTQLNANFNYTHFTRPQIFTARNPHLSELNWLLSFFSRLVAHLSSISFPSCRAGVPRFSLCHSDDLARQKNNNNIQINPLTTEKRLNKRNKLATKSFRVCKKAARAETEAASNNRN